MLKLPRLDFTGEPGAAMSCPPGSEGAGRKRTPATVQRAALRPYLNGFDHFVKRELRCIGYVRYVDDLLLFSDDRHQLWDWKQALMDRLAHLRLTIHQERAQVRPVTEGFPFLGFVIYRHKRRIKQRNGITYARKFRSMVRDYEAGRLSLDRVTASVQGWVNHARFGKTLGLRHAVLQGVVISAPKGVASGKDDADFHQDL